MSRCKLSGDEAEYLFLRLSCRLRQIQREHHVDAVFDGSSGTKLLANPLSAFAISHIDPLEIGMLDEARHPLDDLGILARPKGNAHAVQINRLRQELLVEIGRREIFRYEEITSADDDGIECL